MEEIIKKKIRKTIKEKRLLDLADVMIDLLSNKEINPVKLKPPTIDPYNGAKDPIKNV